MRTIKLFAPVCFIILLSFSAEKAFASDQEESMRHLQELKRDISMLNLLNGLHLTSDQQSALLQDARNAQKITDAYRQRFDALFPESERSLQDLRSELLRGELPPGSPIESRAKQANDEMKRLRESYLQDLSIVERHVSTILNDGQKKIVEDFKPCLVPPRNLKNPTRAGQANDSSGIERMLARARTVSNDVYENRIDKIVDHQIANYEKHYGPLSQKQDEKQHIRSIVDEARGMSDVDFELNKENLAQQIDLRARYARGDTVLLTQGHRPGKLSRFLLDERIIPLLEQQVASHDDAQLSSGARLSSIQPAENCRDFCTRKK